MNRKPLPSNFPSQKDLNGYDSLFPASKLGNNLNGKIHSNAEELIVAAFLMDSGLKFETGVPLYNLKGDIKKIRRADFKLTNLGVYIEYFGQYNFSEEKRTEYDKKAEVFTKNNIPTVFIYPQELEHLEYAFHFKILEVLKLQKFNLRKSLFLYRLNRFKQNFVNTKGFGGFTNLFLSIFLFVFILGVSAGFSVKAEMVLLYSSFSLILINFGFMMSDVRRFLYKDH